MLQVVHNGSNSKIGSNDSNSSNHSNGSYGSNNSVWFSCSILYFLYSDVPVVSTCYIYYHFIITIISVHCTLYQFIAIYIGLFTAICGSTLASLGFTDFAYDDKMGMMFSY